MSPITELGCAMMINAPGTFTMHAFVQQHHERLLVWSLTQEAMCGGMFEAVRYKVSVINRMLYYEQQTWCELCIKPFHIVF